MMMMMMMMMVMMMVMIALNRQSPNHSSPLERCNRRNRPSKRLAASQQCFARGQAFTNCRKLRTSRCGSKVLIGACNLHLWFPLDCNFQTSMNSRGDTTWWKNMLMQNPLHVQKCRWFEDGIRRFPHCFSSFRLLNLHQLQCRCSFSWFPSSHCWNFLV